MTSRVLTHCFLFLIIFVAIPSGTRHGSRWQLIVEGESRLNETRLGRRKLRTGPCWPIEKAGRRCQARSRVSIWSGKHSRESGRRFAILGWCSGFRLVSCKSPNSKILLHQRKLPLLLPLLGIEFVDFGFKSPFMLSKSLIILSLFFKL